jgi:hypothetical protein
MEKFMTQPQPVTPEPGTAFACPNYAAWQTHDKARREALAKHLANAKVRLFDFLEDQGMVLITVDFDGSGDSGQIESINAFDEHGEVALPECDIHCISIDSDTEGGAEALLPVKDVVENLAYDLLEAVHGGWDNNDGAYGVFRFEVTDRTITLAYHERIMTSEYSENSW